MDQQENRLVSHSLFILLSFVGDTQSALRNIHEIHLGVGVGERSLKQSKKQRSYRFKTVFCLVVTLLRLTLLKVNERYKPCEYDTHSYASAASTHYKHYLDSPIWPTTYTETHSILPSARLAGRRAA